MGVVILVGVALGLFGGAYFLTKAPPPRKEEEPESTPAPDAAALRDAVAEKLRERLAGWTIELPEDKPLELAAVEVGTERRLTLDLSSIAPGWYGHARAGRTEEAQNLVEAFVLGATGEGAGTDEALDPESAKQALALALVQEGKAPKRALFRPAGPLEAMLVLRHPNGFDVLASDDLAALGFSADEAFSRAIENLRADVEEGLPVTVVAGTEEAPEVLQVSPDDPVAASYAVLPLFAQKMFQKMKAKDVRYHVVSAGHLFVTAGAQDLARYLDIQGERLESEPIPPGDIAWR